MKYALLLLTNVRHIMDPDHVNIVHNCMFWIDHSFSWHFIGVTPTEMRWEEINK